MCHRGEKRTWPDQDSNPWPLAYGVSTLTTELPSYMVDLWQFNSPCLIRFVPKSALNHAGTDERVTLLLAARARTHTGHQMLQGRKKHMARPGLEPRTSRIPCEHSDHWATEPHGRPVTYGINRFSHDVAHMILVLIPWKTVENRVHESRWKCAWQSSVKWLNYAWNFRTFLLDRREFYLAQSDTYSEDWKN